LEKNDTELDLVKTCINPGWGRYFRRIAQGGKRLIEQKYSRESVVQGLEKEYFRVLENIRK